MHQNPLEEVLCSHFYEEKVRNAIEVRGVDGGVGCHRAGGIEADFVREVIAGIGEGFGGEDCMKEVDVPPDVYVIHVSLCNISK